MLLDWSELTAAEMVEEILYGFDHMDTKNLIHTTLAIVVNEFDVDLREVMITRNKIADLHGDPLEYLDEFSGEIVLDPDE